MKSVVYYFRPKSHRYSAKKMVKPISFSLIAPDAERVSVIGDFNDWDPNQAPMIRQPDGCWHVQIDLHHGHHHYLLLVDNTRMLDPLALGIGRNGNNEKVSLLAVS